MLPHKYVLGVILLLFPLFLPAQSLSTKDEDAIQAVFAMQQDAWNRGDIDAFMEGYWKSEELVFVGSGGPKYGWQTTLERYKKSYPDRATMGQLTFEQLKIVKLGPKSAYVLGKWHLKREMGDAGGYYSLIWRKIKGKWVIVSDHTS
ncbi:MAG: nuclear transport factor 2 family protein [Bacteroidota bacterium]